MFTVLLVAVVGWLLFTSISYDPDRDRQAIPAEIDPDACLYGQDKDASGNCPPVGVGRPRYSRDAPSYIACRDGSEVRFDQQCPDAPLADDDPERPDDNDDLDGDDPVTDDPDLDEQGGNYNNALSRDVFADSGSSDYDDPEGDTAYVGDAMANAEAERREQASARQVAEEVQTCLESEDCQKVSVLFGSNRKIAFGRPLESINRSGISPKTPFSTDLSETLSLGSVDVSVPRARDYADIPRPLRIPLPDNAYVGQRLDPLRHFVLYDYERLSEAAFVGRLGETERAFIFVHGYNVPMKSAVMKAAQIKVDSGFTGQAMIFSWPTKHPLRGRLALGYGPSRENAIASQEAFREFLELVRASTNAAEIHIITHSMGNRVALAPLAAMAKAKTGLSGQPVFGELIMAAPDVERAKFLTLMEEIDGLFAHATLYASRADFAMALSRQVCRITRAPICPPRAGEIPPQPAVPAIAETHETIDVTNIKDDFFNLELRANFGHGYYAADRPVLDDIGRIIVRRDHPAVRRTPSLRRVEVPPHFYWQYP